MNDVLKFGKKLFTVSVVALTIVWSMGVAALVPAGSVLAETCPTLVAGDLYKVSGQSAVYLLTSDLKSMYFPNAEVYNSWYSNFSGVKVIPGTCFDTYPQAKVPGVNYRSGARLVKRVESPSVYAVLPGNVRAKLASADVAAALYGANWATLVRDIHAFHWANMTDGSEIASSVLQNGQEVKVGATGKVYAVKDGKTYEVVGDLGVMKNDVRTVSQAVFDSVTAGGTTVTSASLTADPSQGVTGTGVTGDLSVGLSADTAVANTLASGSVYNKVLGVNVRAGANAVVVTGLTVTRGGLFANTNISGVSVWDGTTRLGNVMTALTSDGKVTLLFGTDKVTVPANSSKTLTVAVNLASGAISGTLNFYVAGAADVKTEGTVNVTGSFPVTGNTMSVVDGSNSLGSVRVDDVSVGGLAYATIASATGNVSVGDTQKEVGKFSLTQQNSKEAVQLEKMVVYVEGTIQEATDLSNWTLTSPEGTVLATATKPVNRYVTFNLTSPYVIDKGLTKNFSVKADLTDGSGRYFRTSIQNDYDLMVKGVTTGAYTLPTDSLGNAFDSADTQNANGGFLIKQGALTVSKSATSPSTKLAPGSQNAVLAKFDLKSNGEKLEIRKMRLGIVYGTTALTGSVNVRDAETGETYLSISADSTGLLLTSAPTIITSTTEQNLSSYITIESGKTKTIEVTGTLLSTASTAATYKVYVAGFYAKRYSTNDYATLPDSTSYNYAGNQLGVNDVSLNVTKDASFGTTNRAPGATAVKIGQFVLQATSADDIKMNGLTVGVESYAKIQNLMLKNEGTGAQIGATVGSPAVSNAYTFDTTIAKDKTLVLGVYADVLASQTGSVSTTIDAGTVTGYGVTSSKNLSSVPAADVAGQTINLGSATLVIKADANRPTSKVVLSGSKAVELNRINLEASKENITLKKLTLSLATASSTQWTTAQVAADIDLVYLYDGSTLLNEGGSKLESTTGTITLTGLNVTLTQDTPKVLTVKADITGSGILTPSSVAAMNVYSTSSDYFEAYSGSGLMETGITLTSSAQGNYMLFHDTAPTIAWSGAAAGQKTPDSLDIIGKYTITNSGSRLMTITGVTTTVTASGLTDGGQVTSFKLYDEADNLLAESSEVISSSTASTSRAIFFNLSSAAQEVGAAGTKTFTLKADTSGIRTGLTAGQFGYLSTKIDGSKGYLSTQNATNGSEILWNDSNLTFSYTPVGGSAQTGLRASDSVPVQGATYSY